MSGFLEHIERYYSEKLKKHGTTNCGVDWNSLESQYLRFEQLSKIFDPHQCPDSVIDFGCGFGEYLTFLKKKQIETTYFGIDISKDMLAAAKGRFPEKEESFVSDLSEVPQSDYLVASGVFNVKQNESSDSWLEYVLKSLHNFDKKTIRGFAFNVLTSYSDREFMREDLFYADPLFLFDYCKRNFSKEVALLHNYGLYEFTLLVNK